MSKKEIALVTGASAGFGRAICKMLINNNYKVIALARREDKLLELKNELGDDLYPLVLDVTDTDKVLHIFDYIEEDLHDIDLLINNAGLALSVDKVQDAKFSNFKTMVDTNVLGLLAVTNAILPSMVKRNKGYIINLGSIAGDYPYQGGNVYGATKAFVAQFSKNLRTDLVGTAIKVTNIKPGLCSDTEFSYVRLNDEQKVKDLYKDVEAITPDDIAHTVSFLINLPWHVNINEIEMMPVAQCYHGPSVVKNLQH